jgi:predicted Zn-dependent protease
MATAQPTNNYQARRQNVVARQLLTDRMLENMNVTMRGQSIMQLDASAREVIQNRYQRFQDAAKLDQQWGEWQAQWPSFMDKYWSFTDPERKFSSEEVNQAIAALERCDGEDFAAKIATALLLERAGRINAGLEIIDPVLEAKTGLQPVALAAKAMLLSAVDKDKEATTCMQTAIKLQRDNPYVHWIRATIAASQEQWGAADTELKRLATVKPMELAVRRLSSLIHAARAAKSPAESKKAILDAEFAIDLEPQPTWYSYLVLAVAQASAKDKAAALASLEKAESKADEGSRAWCNQLQEALERGDAIDWSFDRRLVEED